MYITRSHAPSLRKHRQLQLDQPSSLLLRLIAVEIKMKQTNTTLQTFPFPHPTAVQNISSVPPAFPSLKYEQTNNNNNNNNKQKTKKRNKNKKKNKKNNITAAHNSRHSLIPTLNSLELHEHKCSRCIHC